MRKTEIYKGYQISWYQSPERYCGYSGWSVSLNGDDVKINGIPITGIRRKCDARSIIDDIECPTPRPDEVK